MATRSGILVLFLLFLSGGNDKSKRDPASDLKSFLLTRLGHRDPTALKE
jgi:hypothetical protein